MFALALALSLVGLGIGPLLVALGRGRALPWAAVDGLVLGAVPAILGLRVLPHLWDELGAATLALGAVGYLALWITERRRHRMLARVGEAVVVPALAIHAITDGAGLAVAFATPDSSVAPILGLAILLHRVPEGLGLARALVPEVGWRRALSWIGLLGAANVAGALAGKGVLEAVPHELSHGFVAVGLGALLRLMLHTHEPVPRSRPARLLGAAAFVAGLAVAFLAPPPHELLGEAQSGELAFTAALSRLALRTAPAVLVGLAASALLAVTVRRRSLAPPGRLVDGLVGAIAEPRRMSRARRLGDEGMSVATRVALILAAPRLDVAAFAVALALLGVPFAATTVIAGVALAALVAGATTTTANAPGPSPATAHAPAGERAAGERAAGERAAGERIGAVVDAAGGSYVLGLVGAALLEAALTRGAFVGVPFATGLGLAAATGALVHVGAIAALPIAAVLVHKGLPASAALALVLAGAAAGAGELSTSRGFARATIVRVVLATAVVAALLGMSAAGLLRALPGPDLHALLTAPASTLERGALVAVAVLVLVGIARLGPRGWLRVDRQERGDGHRHGEHGHAHGEHGHAHEEKA